MNIPRRVVEEYREFHGADPGKFAVVKERDQVDLVLAGDGVSCMYGIVDKESRKEGLYKHDFEKGVKVYRRGKRPKGQKVLRLEPRRYVFALGRAVEVIYRDSTGKEIVLRPKKTMLCKWGRSLVAVSPDGIAWIVRGGKLRVTDWIRG